MRAMILAAGLGARMRPLTDSCPKPLLPVAGKPLIVHHIERLAHAGITDIVINVSHLGEQIIESLGDGSRWGVTITICSEAEPLETAGGIINALPWLADDDNRPFLVLNGDIWCDYPFAELSHSTDGLAHLVLVDNPEHNPSGDFALGCSLDSELARAQADNRRQPSALSLNGALLTFSGISLLRPSLFSACVAGKQPLAPLLRRAIEQGLASGEHYQGYWVDVGTPTRLAELELRLGS